MRKIVIPIPDDFSIHYQVWKNRLAVEQCLIALRKHFPTVKVRLVSDNGADYSDFVNRFSVDYEFKSLNIFPGGRLQKIEQCYEWLSRVQETCQLYDSKWIVIFEDDVLTCGSHLIFPKADSAGVCVHSWSNELIEYLSSRNFKNKHWGFGMCGGSVFLREAFLDSYAKIEEFDLVMLSKLDSRVRVSSDTLINCFLQYFGYSYQIWDSMGEGDNITHRTCFIHAYKEFY